MMLVQTILTIYGSMLLAMSFFQENLIFFPDVLPSGYKFSFTMDYEEKWLDLKGEKIHSLLFKSPHSKGVILFFHGNAGSLDGWGQVAEEIVERSGWDVWMVDYPGYGKSAGRITSENQLLDLGRVFLKTAKEKYPPPKKIILYGRSIGSGIAVKVASENEIAGLILETPFYSLQSLAKQLYPWVPPFIIKYKFRSDLWIKSVRCPILIIHGTDDQIVPYEQGKLLSEAAEQANLVPIKRGDHNNLETFPEYWSELKKFLGIL